MSLRHVIRPRATRRYSSSSGKQRSPHADWYAEVLPSMIPVALLGSTIYLGLHLIRTHLATERHADILQARVDELELELQSLQSQQTASSEDAKQLLATPSRFRRWSFF